MQNEGYAIKKIASIVGGQVIGNQSDKIIVKDILFDSRLLIDAENTSFFALYSGRNDGHKYITELYEKGVKVFVVNENYAVLAKHHSPVQCPNATYIVVNDTLAALQKLAAHHRAQFNIPVVGITGSNGKTIVKEWLYQILSPLMSVCRSPKSYNSQIGVPLSVWHKYLDECGGANIFLVKDNTYVTPLSRSILPSIINDSLMTICRDLSIAVEQRRIPVEELSTFAEAASCGTGAAISPISRIIDPDNGITYEFGEQAGAVCARLYKAIRDIQYARTPDIHHWCHFLAP